MAEENDSRWQTVFERRALGTDWPQEAESQLQTLFQSGQVPSYLLLQGQLPPLVPKTEVQQAIAEMPPSMPAGARAVRQAGDTRTPPPPTTTVPSFVAAPTAMPANPAEIPKYLLDQYGPGLLLYPATVAAALATRNLPLLARTAIVPATTAVSQLVGETLTTPALGTPEARGEYTPRFQRAARTALITGGAMLGGAAVPPAQQGTTIFQKATEVLAGMATTGSGAAVGSLAAEPIAPTSDPLATAFSTGKEMAWWEGGFRLGSKLLGALFGPRSFAPRGEEAAQTFKEEGIVTPGTVTLSTPAKSLESGAEGAFFGSTRLRTQRLRGEEKLTGRLEETKAQGALPTDVNVRAALDQHGYVPGFSDAAKTAQRNARQGLYDEVDTMLAGRVARMGVPVHVTQDVSSLAGQLLPQVPAGTPLHTALTTLQQTPTMTTPNLQRLSTVVDQASQATGLSPEIQGTLGILTTKLSNAVEYPTVLNMSALARTIEQLRQDASGMVSPEMHTLLDRASSQGYMMSLRDARNLRSDLMQEARAMETGGRLRAPTPTGQTPTTGTGNALAPRLRRQVNVLEGAIERSIEGQSQRFGPEVYTTHRLAQEAGKVAAKQRWLEDFFSGADVYDRDRGLFKGRAILDKLENIKGSEERLGKTIGENTLANIDKFANALTKLQETAGESPASIYHQIIRLGTRAAQIGGAGVAAYGGHPELAMIIGATPEALSFIVSSPKLSSLLMMGLRAPAGSKQGWEALGRVAGALHAAGVQPYSPPASNDTGQTPADRETTFLTDYRRSLAAAPMDQAEQYWRDYLAAQPDATAKTAFQQAFQERFGRPVGGASALLP